MILEEKNEIRPIRDHEDLSRGLELAIAERNELLSREGDRLGLVPHLHADARLWEEMLLSFEDRQIMTTLGTLCQLQRWDLPIILVTLHQVLHVLC